MQYRDHLDEQHFDAAAELYESAFGPKFSRAIRKRADRLELIRESFRGQFGFSAVDGEHLVGLAGHQSKDGSLTSGMTGAAIIGRLGLLRGLWACAILGLYDRKARKGELVMDGIVVDDRHRGRGVGTALLNRVVAFAAENGYTTVRLDVIDTNHRARRLYERFGFEVEREERYGFLKPILGFGGSATMVYRLTASSSSA